MTVPRPALAVGLALLLSAGSAAAQTVPTSTRSSSVAPAAEQAEEPAPPPAKAERLHPDDPAADRTGTPPLPPQGFVMPPPSAEPGEERPVPDYDRRPDEPPDAADVLIWVPRVIFSPVQLTLEYGLRWPMVKAITLAEQHKIFKRIENIFTFRDGKSGIFPTALIDFGLKPSIGIYSFHNDVGYEGHDITLQAGFWVDNWKHLALRDRWEIFDGEGELAFGGEYSTRPDDPFYGVGYDAQYENRTNFRFRRTDAEVALSSYLSGLNQVGLSFRFRDGLLSGGQHPEVSDLFRTDDLNGYGGDGYQLLSFVVAGAIDTRDRDLAFTAGTGFRLDLHGGFHASPGESDVSFLRFGGEAALFYDFSGRNHVLGLSVYTDFIETLGDAPPPVSELILLGGNEHLRGFLLGRFRGESALVAKISYRYPIWILMDADLFAEVGNVFGPRLEDFGWKRLVFDAGLALRTAISRDTSIDALIAFGTNRFDEPNFELDNVRATLGANHGF